MNGVVAIVQARLGSSRFPRKVLARLGDDTVIDVLVKRLRASKLLDGIVIAIPDSNQDNELAEFCAERGYQFFRGDEHDVLKRYVEAARNFKASCIVRITADCPLIDPSVVDATLNCYADRRVDYCSNCHPPKFPDGLDVEVFGIDALIQANLLAVTKSEREHVTPVLQHNPIFKTAYLTEVADYSSLRWTIDEPEDLNVVERIFWAFYPNTLFCWREAVSLCLQHPEFFQTNSHIRRNSGYHK